MSSDYSDSLYRVRTRGKLTGNRLELLRLLQRAYPGPVTEELMRYQLWRRRKLPEPEKFHYNISHIKLITGLGIVFHRDEWIRGKQGWELVPAPGWCLAPELNEPWCEPEKWEDV